MEKLWFKRKRYGWGWTPATKEGWIVILGAIALWAGGMLAFMKKMETNPTPFTVVVFVGFVILWVGALTVISYKKGEAPKWQWGEEKK